MAVRIGNNCPSPVTSMAMDRRHCVVISSESIIETGIESSWDVNPKAFLGAPMEAKRFHRLDAKASASLRWWFGHGKSTIPLRRVVRPICVSPPARIRGWSI